MKKSITKFGIAYLKTIYCLLFFVSTLIRVCLPIYGLTSVGMAGFFTLHRNYPDAIIVLCFVILMYAAYYIFIDGVHNNLYKASIDLQYSYKAAPVVPSRQTRKELRRIEKIIGSTLV